MMLRAVASGILVLLASSAVGCGSSSGGVDDAGFVDLGAADLGTSDTGAATDRGAPTDRGTVDAGAPAACGAGLGACNIATNAGCTTGNGCYAVRGADGGVASQCAMAGAHGWGDTCASANDCREGFACLGSPGSCMKLCCGSDNASCRDETRGGHAGALCAGGITGTDVRTCMDATNCDVYATTNNGCPADRPRCEFIAADGTTNCFAAQAGSPTSAEGGPCCVNNRCQPGFVCVPRDLSMATAACIEASPNRLCRRACDMNRSPDAGTQCPSGQACTVGFNGAPTGYGACAPSM